MPATTLYRADVLDHFIFEVAEKPRSHDVAVREIVCSGEGARSFRLADAPEILDVRVAEKKATLIGPAVDPDDSEPARLDVAARALAALARLLSAWTKSRRTFAAYVGAGVQARWFGFVPLCYFEPGALVGERVGRDDRRLEALRAAPRAIRAVSSKRRVGGHEVEHELRSGLDEPVGVVASVRGAGSILLARGAAVVGIDDDADRLVALALHVATGGQGGDPEDACGLSGVIVRPDAVDAIAEAARTK